MNGWMEGGRGREGGREEERDDEEEEDRGKESTWRAGPRAGLESGGRAEFHRLHSVYTAHWCHDQARSSNHALCRASDRAATAAVGNACCGAAAALLRWRRASS